MARTFKCAKCTAEKTTVTFDETDDSLLLECERCGYKWTELPSDKLDAPAKTENSDVHS